MTNKLQGVDPGLFWQLSGSAKNLAGEADDWLSRASPMMWQGDLVTAVNVLALCREVSEEMGLLAELAESKAKDITTASSSGKTLALQAQLDASLGDDTGREISAKEMEQKLAAAVESGDEDEIRRVSRIMWNTVAGMDDEEAERYLERINGAAVIVAVETTGLPRSKPAIDFMANQLTGRQNYTALHDDAFVPYLLEEHDIDVADQEALREYSKERLIEFSRKSGQNAQMLMERLPTGTIDGDDKHLAEVYEVVTLENPTEFAVIVEANVKHAQGIADLLAAESSDETLQQITENLVALTVEGFNPNADSAEAAYNDQYLAAAGVLTRSLEAAGKGISIDWNAALKFGISKSGPAGAAVVALDSFIVVDDTGQRRGAETERRYIIKDLALTIMAMTDPETAQLMTDHMDMNKPLSEQWGNVPSGKGREDLQRARNRLEEIEGILSGAWGEGTD